jgi:hypothetical protein
MVDRITISRQRSQEALRDAIGEFVATDSFGGATNRSSGDGGREL